MARPAKKPIQEDRQYPQIVLDRTRPAGEVHGEDTDRAYWEQDGLLFDVHGQLCEHLLNDDQIEDIKMRIARADAAAAAKRAYNRAMEKAGISVEDEDAQAAEDDKVADVITTAHGKDQKPDDDVDLLGWFHGQKRYEFFKVTAAMQAKFNLKPTNVTVAKEMLANEFKLPLKD